MGADVLAGLSVAGLLLPEAVAYAGIGGVPPVHALAAAVVGLLVYAAIGRSRFAIVAPTSSSAAIMAASVADIAVDPSQRATLGLALGLAMVLAAGGFFLAAGAARLGSMAAFVSRPVLRGFAFGLAVTIVVKQLPLVVGVQGVGGMPLRVLLGLAARVRDWNWFSAGIGVAALLLLLGLRRLRGVPAAFVVLVVGIGLSFAVDLEGRHVGQVGALDVSGLMPGFPDLPSAAWLRAGQVALPLFLIVFAESWGTIRTLALRNGDVLDPNRELLALGAANVGAALVQGMPVGAGFSAGSANEAAGAVSRWAGVAAACALVALLLGASGLIARLPEPVLAAVVIAALMHALDPAPLWRLWVVGRDLWVALAGVAGVLVLGVLDGMLIAIGLSLATALQRFARPHMSVLGELGGSGNFVDSMNHPDAVVYPGVAVFRPNEPLFFANAERVFGAIFARSAPARVVIVSLEESADLDSTAADALIEFARLVAGRGQTLLLARAKDEVQARLARAGGTGFRCYRSVDDAAKVARAG
jgi:MFS superfamily sulfate permease-like transporter